MQVDERFVVDSAESSALDKFFSVVVVGLAFALKEKSISVVEAERILFSPYMATQLARSRCSSGLVDLIERGCELEDVESLIPNQFPDVIDGIIKDSLSEIKKIEEILQDGQRLFAKKLCN
ncbi:DUF3969 family protein [Pseudomonas sp. LABIM340]|nr:DUF3969 family protein [Pseudomonas nitroreducens]